MFGVFPELVAELFAVKEEKKERNDDSRGLAEKEVVAAPFFLRESEESDECEASLPERGRTVALAVVVRLDGPADRSASEMSSRPCPRLDMVLSRSRSALRHAGVLAESV